MGCEAASAPAETSQGAAARSLHDVRSINHTYRQNLRATLAKDPPLGLRTSPILFLENTAAGSFGLFRMTSVDSNIAVSSHEESLVTRLNDNTSPAPNSARGRSEQDNHSNSFSRGVSATTTKATPRRFYSPTFSTAAYLQSPGLGLGSFTSPECDLGQTEGASPTSECPILISESDSGGQEPCSRVTTIETATATIQIQEAHVAAINQPGSHSLRMGAAQKRDEVSNCEDTDVKPCTGHVNHVEIDGQSNRNGRSGVTEREAASPELIRNLPRTAPPRLRRSKSARSSTGLAGHRAMQSSRMPKKGGNRALPNSRGLYYARTSRSPSDSTTPVSVKHAVAKSRRSRQVNNKQGLQNYRAQHGVNTVIHSVRTPVLDMEGVPHVVGGLVENSLGLKNPLFAKQGEEDQSEYYKGVGVGRHYIFQFPPPDMGDHNREFERELEESRPVYDGFDLDLIDKQVDGYAARTKLVAKVMEAHRAEFDPVNQLFLTNKKELMHLDYERQRAITSEYSVKHRTTPRERARTLATVAQAEAPLLENEKRVKDELKEIIINGRAKIARLLQLDLRAPTTIDEKRAKASQRKILEEQDTELGVAGAMIGLRGSMEEQSPSTQTAIMRFAQFVALERLKAFDEKDSWRKPDKSLSIEPISNVDTVITVVPDWFTILDAKGTVDLRSEAPLERLKELLQTVGTLSINAREEEWADELRPNRHAWNKHYHEPDDAWPNALQRRRGGWWACRSGRDATPAERSCKLCHSRTLNSQRQISAPSAKARCERILDEIQTAQAEANERDRLMLKHHLQQERDDINRYWQQREWVRSGGGVDVSEVLHGRDVNELNYRPSAVRSQSFQQPDVSCQSVEPHGEQAIEAESSPRVRCMQHSEFQIHKLSSGRMVNKVSCPPATSTSSPSQRLGCSPLLHDVLTGRQTNKRDSPREGSNQLARPLRGSPLFHELLAGRQVNGNTPQSPPPPLSLYRHNSSQAHDALHGRLPKNGTSPTQVGLSQLRSSMARPGQRSKKRVSWRL
ncbi:hypothetical protein C7999DRAFT_17440 [Corynascus novoguineensis]|uniref:Uncharacterized protein n=1 Tax=Corynascus novoguineensis TaxID=1126955 RepID=A0AAN7CLJ4_9PEZI|nr:hypothetical protein C7999DRAFT_17440 [Corynascus novoguineensis]